MEVKVKDYNWGVLLNNIKQGKEVYFNIDNLIFESDKYSYFSLKDNENKKILFYLPHTKRY